MKTIFSQNVDDDQDYFAKGAGDGDNVDKQNKPNEINTIF